jgi:methylmalonyl-CoA/ethylmalonyl-CoA epimerase
VGPPGPEGATISEVVPAKLGYADRVGTLKIKRLDHVAVCVDDIDAAAALWHRAFGLEARQREVVQSQKTAVALLPLGETNIELISPRGNEGLARFLEKRGPGLHHVAVEVEGIEDAIALLEGLGIAMIDHTPRTGARGHKVAFVHPKATGGVLVELVEPSEHEATIK